MTREPGDLPRHRFVEDDGKVPTHCEWVGTFVFPGVNNLIQAAIKSFSYSTQKPVLKDIHLEITEGEFVVLTGVSGSGKSTLAQCLTGVIPHYVHGLLNGHISVLGHDLSTLTLPAISAFAGYCGPEPQNQLFNLSVFEDVAFGPGNLGLNRQKVIERTKLALKFVGGEHLAPRNPGNLSGGETQRCALASYMAMGQRLLVLDQPCRELDPAGRRLVYENLRQLQLAKGLTLVIVDSRPSELIGLAGRYIVMEGGSIVVDRDSGDFLQEHNLSGLGLLPDYSLHRDSECRRQEKTPESGSLPVAVTKDLCFGYPQSDKLFTGLNLTIRASEIISLIGPNGAGKTTLAKLLTGILKPTGGEIKVNGVAALVFQNPDHQLFGSSIFNEVAFSLKRKKLPVDVIKIKVYEALSHVGLQDLAYQHPYTLNRGQRKLLALSTALALEPKLIIADEPTAGLDGHQSELAAEAFRSFCQRGGAILLISHDLDLVFALSERTILLKDDNIREVRPGGIVSSVLRS